MPVDWTKETDGALLSAAARHTDAFAEFYDRYEALVAATLRRKLGDAELAADLTAETFCQALLNAHRFQDTGGPAAGWVLGIARHAALRTWERGRVEDRGRRRLGVERVAFSDASLERVEALVDSAALGNPVMRALEALPERQREAIREHLLSDRPYPDVAARLGVPAATVRQRVSRGLARMRTNLEETQT